MRMILPAALIRAQLEGALWQTGASMCTSAAQGAVTIAVRYGAARQQFGPPDAPEISVLDYTSQQEKLMPMLATAYALHFTTRYLVAQYTEAKRTKEEEIIADVHALSAGAHRHAFTACPNLFM